MMWRQVSTIMFANLIFAANAFAAPVHWNGNGNYYEFVSGVNINWVVARDAASAMSYLGVPGHLVTITSQAENDFITANLNNGQPLQAAWIGGYEPNDDGVWIWAVGPEAGVQFSLFASPTPPYNFANWGGIEPNDNLDGEDYAGMIIGQAIGPILPGQWGDGVQTPSPFDPIVGYLVEYETHLVPEPASLLLFSITGLGLLTGRAVRTGRRPNRKTS